jgi:hypothetical protein
MKRKNKKAVKVSKGKQASLYPTTKFNPNNYRPRIYNMAVDTKKAITPSDRSDYLSRGRELFATLPDLGGALLSKAAWSVGPSSFTAIHTGTNTEWGNLAEKWLEERFYPMCNVQGNNFDFRTTLNLSSLALDVDGDTLMILTKSRSGFPQVQIVPSHRIATRGNTNVVETGKYAGLSIIDGVIVNVDGRPIAYNILGETPEDDYQVTIRDAQLLYEPEWCDQYRGVSRVARPLLDFTDTQDIDEFLKRGVKLGSSIGIIHTTEGGSPDSSAMVMAIDEDAVTEGVPPAPPLQMVNGGEIMYLKANAGESITSLKDERPSQDVASFLERIQRRALFACGWPIELLDPSKVGGASVRLIQDLARRSIAQRQVTLEKRAKLMVNYAVAVAMQTGQLPQNNDDWYNWSFTKGAAITVDQGNESNSDRAGYVMGLNTMSEISSKRGLDWQEVRQQNQKEVEDLLDRANNIAKSKGVPFETALTLLQQSTPNASPVAPPQAQETK